MCYIVGIPDAPSSCILNSVSQYTAVMTCVPGYAGGEPLEFMVYKSSPFHPQAEVYVNVDSFLR